MNGNLTDDRNRNLYTTIDSCFDCGAQLICCYSTMARNFSDSLNSAFAIHENTTPQLEDLAQSVSQKKAAVDSQTSELQALEARIKEMDRRLEQRNSRTSSPAGRGGQEKGGGLHFRPQVGDTLSGGTAGAGVSAVGAAVERKPFVGNPSPLADRAANLSSEQGYPDRTEKATGGVENLSTNSRGHWMQSGEAGLSDERG